MTVDTFQIGCYEEITARVGPTNFLEHDYADTTIEKPVVLNYKKTSNHMPSRYSGMREIQTNSTPPVIHLKSPVSATKENKLPNNWIEDNNLSIITNKLYSHIMKRLKEMKVKVSFPIFLKRY